MKHAQCTRDSSECRIRVRSWMQQPMIAWAPEFDGAGNRVNSDPNVFVQEFTCATCGETWTQTANIGAPAPPIIVGRAP